MGATAILCEFASRTQLSDISTAAITATKRHILDCTGVALAAATEPAGRVILEVTREQGGTPQARVLAPGLRTSAVAAAWANGSLAHLLDFDDTGFSHPTACILPAALAVAEMIGASGGALVAAVCVGLEVFERLSLAGRQHEAELRRRGFHPTSLYGCPAAAAAAGNILGLNPEQLAAAIGLAAANAGGLTQHFGTWGKAIHAGNAARSGVMSALLAQKDYVADLEAIEGAYGFFSALHGSGNYTLEKIADGLGARWAIVEPGLTVKAYPCCGGNLRALDAAQALLREEEISFDEVDRLEVDVHPDLLHIVRFHKPTRGFQGKFSIDYVLAAMLLDGRVDIDSFSDEYCNAPRMRAALEKVQVNVRPEWSNDPQWRRHTPVTIVMSDGRTFTRTVERVRGSPGNPMSRNELVGKARSCAARLLEDAAVEKSILILESLDELPSVDVLMNAISLSIVS